MSREAGFRWPVAITAGAWADCVAWDDADGERQTIQDLSGRLWTCCSWLPTLHGPMPLRVPALLALPCAAGTAATEAEFTRLKLVVGRVTTAGRSRPSLLPNED